MSRRSRVDPRRIKIHISYTVEEIAGLLGCHKRSVRNWIKLGLATLEDGKRPLLIQGEVARAYLEERKRKARRRCQPDELYCLKCRQPRSPAAGSSKLTEFESAAPMLSGQCSSCGIRIFKRVSAQAADTLRRQMPIEDEAGARTLKQAA